MSKRINHDDYLVQLDGIRFIAIFMVMIAHWLQWQLSNTLVTKIQFVHGVTLFFVLSGFLITRILLENRKKYDDAGRGKMTLIRQFYIRRFLRIFPIYYLTIFFLALISYPGTREYFPWLITYTSNVYQSINNQYIGNFNHFWSLAVEEQFYMFWPWLMLFVNKKHLPWVIAATIVLSIASRVYLHVAFPGHWMAGSYLIVTCMYALGLGAMLAWLHTGRKTIVTKMLNPYLVWGSVVVYTIMLYLFISVPWYKALVDELLFVVMSALVINYAVAGRFRLFAGGFLQHPWVAYFGKVSYGMYVYHLFIPDLFYYLSPHIGLTISNKYTAFVAFFVLTFVMSHLSWILIESPVNSLKKFFPYFVRK